MVSANAEKSIKNQLKIYQIQKLFLKYFEIRFLKDFLRSNPIKKEYETIRNQPTLE